MSFSFRNRSLYIIILGIILVHLVLFVFYVNQSKKTQTNVNRDIIIQQVINLIERINYTAPAKRNKVVSAVDISNLSISLNTKPMYKLRFNSDSSLWEISQALRKQRKEINLSLEYNSKSWLNISMPFLPASRWFFLFLLILELVVVFAIIFSIWSINRFSKPLKKFKKAAERLGVDFETPPLKIYGPEVVRETAFAMNQLQARIRELIRERTNMLAALSHDLRTPITRIKLRTQFTDDEELKTKTLADLDEMEAMISETLKFARQENLVEQHVKLDLNSLMQTICDDFIDMDSPVEYQQSQKRAIIKGNSISLRRAFNNIIANGLKYGNKVDVSLLVDTKKVIVLFRDHGPGLSEDQIEKVFEPFYRVENSRSKNTGGTGLGLAVVRTILRRHHSQIQLINAVDGGLIVRVEFYLA